MNENQGKGVFKGESDQCYQIMLRCRTRKGLWSARFSHKEVASDLGKNLFKVGEEDAW